MLFTDEKMIRMNLQVKHFLTYRTLLKTDIYMDKRKPWKEYTVVSDLTIIKQPKTALKSHESDLSSHLLEVNWIRKKIMKKARATKEEY